MQLISKFAARRFRFDRSLALTVGMFGAFSVAAFGAQVTLDNGVVGDGHLSVVVDDFGSFADAFQGGPSWPDLFNPSPDPNEGELGEEFATFSTNVYLFVDPSGVGNGTHRVALSGHSGIQATYPDPTFECVVGDENTTNNLPLSTSSTFRCIAGGVSLNVALTQTVSDLVPGKNGEERAQIEQTYRITSNGAPVNLIITKHIDEDMPWGGGGAPAFAQDDLVGVDFSELERPQVYAQDRELTTAALVLRTREDMTLDPLTIEDSFVYYVGKQALPTPPGNPQFPGGACPPHDYGTDTEIWDNFGVPNCWKNFVPAVGYGVPGISPQIVGDSFMGLQVSAALVSSSTYEITFATLYGFRPPPTTQIPPPMTVQTIQFDQATGCGEFLWSLKNINPLVAGKDPVLISEFYIDVEAGDGGDICAEMTPPSGWTAELCGGFTANGHAMYKFSGGTPIPLNGKVVGRLKIDTNGLAPTINPDTNINVPALSVVLHTAQGQPDALCSFVFGPSTEGQWGLRTIATAHLPVPAMDTWAKTMLALVVAGVGTALVLRSRRLTA